MNNKKVILSFLNKEKNKTCLRDIVNGYYIYKGRTLTTDGSILVNYSTVIASWNQDGSINLNMKKYSVTTSKIQQLIKRLATDKKIIINEIKEGNL